MLRDTHPTPSRSVPTPRRPHRARSALLHGSNKRRAEPPTLGDRGRDLAERAVVSPLQRRRGDAEAQPSRAREIVAAVGVVVVYTLTHVRVAPVEFEPDLESRPAPRRGSSDGDRSTPRTRASVVPVRTPSARRATSASHSLRRQRELRVEVREDPQVTAHPGRFGCFSSRARRSSAPGFTSPSTIASRPMLRPASPAGDAPSSTIRIGASVRAVDRDALAGSRSRVVCRPATAARLCPRHEHAGSAGALTIRTTGALNPHATPPVVSSSTASRSFQVGAHSR